MEWQVLIVLLFAVTIILFPVVFIWYLNIGGIYIALREMGKFRITETVSRVARITLAVIAPLSIYATLIWFFYGHFGWQVAVAVAVVLPIVLLVPALIWAAVISGLYQVALDRLRRRARVTRRRTVSRFDESVTHEVT